MIFAYACLTLMFTNSYNQTTDTNSTPASSLQERINQIKEELNQMSLDQRVASLAGKDRPETWELFLKLQDPARVPDLPRENPKEFMKKQEEEIGKIWDQGVTAFHLILESSPNDSSLTQCYVYLGDRQRGSFCEHTDGINFYRSVEELQKNGALKKMTFFRKRAIAAILAAREKNKFPEPIIIVQ